jgi:RNA polymerase sigma-70 factor (ECF subfamily)
MVAKNHCLMHLRGNGSKMIKELKEEHIRKAEEEKDNLKENERTYEKLEQAINELNEEQRQCVILFYLKKNSYQQISEITSYSTMQVKSYIQNGKRNLRIILDKKLKEANSGNNG